MRQRLNIACLLLASLFLASCAGPGSFTRPAGTAGNHVAVPTSVSASTILAPSHDPAVELERLPRIDSAPVALRRAFLELQLGHARAAIDATSQVLYGTTTPPANEEALARYLRAQAYVQRGTGELAAYDLERARTLAMDPELSRLLGEMKPPERAPGSSVGTVAIYGRSQWGADRPDGKRLDPMDRATRITVHHSAMYLRDEQPAATAAQLRRIQHEHMAGRGYGDIGYHYLIDPAGRVWQGRDMRYQGAHASGANNVRNIGVCVLGNFIRGGGGQGPTTAQVASLRQLLGALMRDHHIAANAIHRHSDFKATECPGPLLAPIVNQLARELGGERGHPVASRNP